MSVGRDTFFRLDTDRRRTGAGLDDVFAGPVPTPVWLVCGGPSLSADTCRVIANSPAPVMAVNLAGHGLLRPDMWTSYDPTCRFLRSLYLDASVRKFLHGRRASDLVPETTFKVCDSPDVYFFDRDVGRVFGSLIDFGSERIVDWADSMVQAIDILSRLGFRKIYLAGADLYVRPSGEQVEAADGRGVIYQERMPLDEFASACRSAGLSEADLAALPAGRQYHFLESKPWGSVVQTDRHYFRVVQWLRQSRRNLALHGIELISVTPGSRLNDHFESATVAEGDAAIRRAVGDPATEVTEGLYHTAAPRLPEGCGPMRDIPPLNATPDLPDARDGDAAGEQAAAGVERPGCDRFDPDRIAAGLPAAEAVDVVEED